MAARTQSATKKKIMIAGFSEVGKTTLLAALWHVLTSRGEVPGALTMASLPKEAEHLNALRDKWQSCESVPRTFVSSEHSLALELAGADGGHLGTVVLPDLAGETFTAQWTQRQAPGAMAALFAEACGVLLVVHSTKINQPERLRDQNAVANMLGGGAKSESKPESAPQQAVPWEPEHSGTDIQLVDLLQCIRFHQGERGEQIRLALGVSAWDLVDDQSPTDWLRRRLPLLQQYLDANADSVQLRVYGISAQGGAYEKGTDDLLEKLNPAERIKIVGNDCRPHDVTAPIAWLLSS